MKIKSTSTTVITAINKPSKPGSYSVRMPSKKPIKNELEPQIEHKNTDFTSGNDESSEMLDMVIAFDTTGSMVQYIDTIRSEVISLIPQLFDGNENLRLGIVAFGDYCDSRSAEDLGFAYQCIHPTDDQQALVRFVRDSQNTHGGDTDEFYELVIRKIVNETPWRKNSMRNVLLIADSYPHDIGYSYPPYLLFNNIYWRKEAYIAAERKIKFDTVAICDQPWMRELSMITSGVISPFKTSGKTSHLLRAAILSRGSSAARSHFDKYRSACLADAELKAVYMAYEGERYMK